MMDKLKTCPRMLLQKLLFTALVGIGCLIIGIAYFLFSKDTMFLGLSGVVFVSCLVRFFGLYLLIVHQRYTTMEGVCVSITPKPLRRYRKVRMMDKDGVETTLLLDNRTKLRIGFSYRCYFKEGYRPSLGSDYLDAALSNGGFLGIEEKGEYTQDKEKVAAVE